MAFLDVTLDELRQYRPERSEPADFDAFWQRTLAESRAYDLAATFELFDAGLSTVDVYDVTYSGYKGQRIKGWFLRPANISEPLPCIVEYIGYGGGRGISQGNLLWSAAGYAHFIMDTRGQPQADTPDLFEGANAYIPGYMTQGILDPETYYYRRVYVDAVRAIEAVLTREDVDPVRIAVAGISQGGGITLAAAGLSVTPALCLPEVPFLCEFHSSVGKTDTIPYHEIVRYLQQKPTNVEQVFRTLDYFDGLNFAPRIQARCLFSVALMDTVCTPASVFAVYNHIPAQKEIKVYTYNWHESDVINNHIGAKLTFVRQAWSQ